MKTLCPNDLERYCLAQNWADKNEIQASFIVLQALWKKYPLHNKVFLAFLEVFEELDLMKAFTFLGDMLAGDEDWQELFYNLKLTEQTYLFEKYGLMALKLKDEVSAVEALKRSASMGRDSLPLWSTLAYLFAFNKDIHLATKALCRALDLYREPSLFEEKLFFFKKNESQNSVEEELFPNICLVLLPQLPRKEALKILSLIQNTFPNRNWTLELQEVVAQEIVTQEDKKVPMSLSGESYVSSDKKNW